MAYEHDQGLPLTAEPSPEVLAHLRHGTSAPGAAIGLQPGAPQPASHAEQVIRSVQLALGQLGYLAAAPDGFVSEQTIRAIREFEMDSGLVPTGRISGPLVARLTKRTVASADR
jgi:peptidoglycan hydrolase-like protein with peptidoglycan-binding domain